MKAPRRLYLPAPPESGELPRAAASLARALIDVALTDANVVYFAREMYAETRRLRTALSRIRDAQVSAADLREAADAALRSGHALLPGDECEITGGLFRGTLVRLRERVEDDHGPVWVVDGPFARPVRISEGHLTPMEGSR